MAKARCRWLSDLNIDFASSAARWMDVSSIDIYLSLKAFKALKRRLTCHV